MRFFHLLLSLTMIVVLGCTDRDVGSPTPVTATTPKVASVRGEVDVRFPPGWLPYVENAPFDLLWACNELQLTTGLFVYDKSTPTNRSPDDTLQYHLNEIRSHHTDFAILPGRTEKQIDKRRLVTVVCRGDNPDQKMALYRVTLVTFSESKVFVVAVQGGNPKGFKQAEPVLSEITDSICRPK